MSRQGMDISNYTQPLTPEQLDYVRDNLDFVCIGLQDANKARAFKAQLLPVGKQLMYYIERPGRDLSIADPGAIVWVDIEEGCFVGRQETLDAIAKLELLAYEPWIYGNRWSIQPVFGQSTELSRYPLVYADYRTPDLATFQGFNGWTSPAIWQYSSKGVAGINADLLESYEEVAGPALDPTLVLKPGVSGDQWINGIRVTYVDGVPVLRLGGGLPGRLAKNFAMHWEWLRKAPDGHAYFSEEEGD